MKMKKSYTIGGLLIIAAMGLAMNAFKSTLTPYVTVEEAKGQPRPVQVAGIAVNGSDQYDAQTNKFVFTLREDGGAEMVVEYDGARPGNFGNVTKVVAIGRYDKKKEAFEAKNLLVKCPTKYEGRVTGK